jgi:signal transduction histidine kinase
MNPTHTADEAAYQAYIRESMLGRVRVFCVLAMVLVPSFWVLDNFLAPEHRWLFLRVRAGLLLCAAGLLALTFTKIGRKYPVSVAVALVFLIAVGLELMIIELGPDSSPYYAGLCLLTFTAGILLPWNATEMALACTVVLAVYFLPIVWAGRLENFALFLNNCLFLFSTAVVTVLSNHFSAGLRRQEFLARTELRQSLDKLRELDQLKSKFFANVSHELRTPLTLILAPIAQLIGRNPSSRERNQLEIVHSNATRLLVLIDELLDLSKLDAGGLRLTLTEVDLSAMAEDLVRSSQAFADSKSIQLVVDAPMATENIFGDVYRLESALSNLIGNALKYTPEGGSVQVRVRSVPGGARVEVQDSGPGISEADQKRIFDRFVQLDRRDRAAGGAGIGLSLARELVDLHDGRLEVRSLPGEGTIFSLWLPEGREHFRAEIIERRRGFGSAKTEGRRAVDGRLKPPSSAWHRTLDGEETFDSVVPPSGRRPRVLVVEDSPDLRRFIGELLSPQYQLLEAEDGEAGLSVARQELPDLIVSDVMMPRMTGTELCRALKSDEALKGIPIILLTARVGPEAALEAYAEGANDFVAKPFHPRVLLARIRSQIQLRELSAMLVAQEKLAAVGTLAAGVAHEIKNPLHAMLNAAPLLLAGGLDDVVREKLLNILVDGAQRIHGIVSALEVHARPAEVGGRQRFALADALDATLRLVEHRMSNVQIFRDYERGAEACGNAGQVNQVFLNLIDNAVRSGAKILWLRIFARSRRLWVEVGDDGPGIPSDVVGRIFDPFFTTRAQGEGTGLGLYVSRRIIEENGGEITCRAREGGGTVFAVSLPAEHQQLEDAATARAQIA